MDTENSHYSRLLHLRLSRVCVAIAATNPSEMLEKAESISRDNPFVELRLDYIPRPGLALPKIREFAETHPHVSIIATCRRAASGGKFKGPINSQVEILTKAAEAGCQLVDVELQTAVRLKSSQLAKLRGKAAVILSFHDFRATQKLDGTLEKMLAYPADFYKIVSTATSLYDNVTMMK